MKSSRSEFAEMRNEINIAKYLQPILEPLLAKCARQWENHVEYNFESKGGAVGGWEGLAEATVELRIAMGYPAAPIMQMRGRLRKSYSIISAIDMFGANLSLAWSLEGMLYGNVLKKGAATYEKDWAGQRLADLQHCGGTGYVPTSEGGVKGIGVPSRPLYNPSDLANMFRTIVEEPFQKAVNDLVASILGGK